MFYLVSMSRFILRKMFYWQNNPNENKGRVKRRAGKRCSTNTRSWRKSVFSHRNVSFHHRYLFFYTHRSLSAPTLKEKTGSYLETDPQCVSPCRHNSEEEKWSCWQNTTKTRVKADLGPALWSDLKETSSMMDRDQALCPRVFFFSKHDICMKIKLREPNINSANFLSSFLAMLGEMLTSRWPLKTFLQVIPANWSKASHKSWIRRLFVLLFKPQRGLGMQCA